MRYAFLSLFFLMGLAACRSEPEPLMQPPTYLFDTDAGPDDVMALAYLLTRDDVEIEAITLSCGLAHVEQGAINLSKVVALSGKGEIPIYIGRPTPLRGERAFPEEWRRVADELPGVDLPSTFRPPESQSAAAFLEERLQDSTRPVRILALGSLTNLATLHAIAPSLEAVDEIVIMGGAFDVPGNVFSTDAFVSPTDSAEWNIFVDPLAAQIVFDLGVPLLIVPLDATNQVPIDTAFIDQFHAVEATPLGRMVGQVLESIRAYAEEGVYYAWDPLAAVALVEPGVVRTVEHAVAVEQELPDAGTTRKTDTGPVARVAYEAERAAFQRLFMEAFARE